MTNCILWVERRVWQMIDGCALRVRRDEHRWKTGHAVWVDRYPETVSSGIGLTDKPFEPRGGVARPPSACV
jgi:hypothetical protein